MPDPTFYYSQIKKEAVSRGTASEKRKAVQPDSKKPPVKSVHQRKELSKTAINLAWPFSKTGGT